MTPPATPGMIVVVSCVDIGTLPTHKVTGKPVIPETEQRKDQMDDFNHPRIRRALILTALQTKYPNNIVFTQAKEPANDLSLYESVHTADGLLLFLSEAWNQWDSLGPQGQDPMCVLPSTSSTASGTATQELPLQQQSQSLSPPFVPGNTPLPRDPYQRPSNHVMGKIGYYCHDTCTPIFQGLLHELLVDAAVVELAVRTALQPPPPVAGAVAAGSNAGTNANAPLVARTVYAIPTHPGHHAAAGSFGGYCYTNHAAAAARLFQKSAAGAAAGTRHKVAVLDIDYHAGNGTASIFYQDPTVLVVSIHCHPDYDYPFHHGFADQTGAGAGTGATLHLPLPPQTTWQQQYQTALRQAVQAISDFGAEALVVSMGLDTYDKDPCAIRRAGFCLQGDDYVAMGETIGGGLASHVPTVFLQEGGYRMDKIGEAAADVVYGFTSARAQK